MRVSHDPNPCWRGFEGEGCSRAAASNFGYAFKTAPFFRPRRAQSPSRDKPFRGLSPRMTCSRSKKPSLHHHHHHRRRIRTRWGSETLICALGPILKIKSRCSPDDGRRHREGSRRLIGLAHSVSFPWAFEATVCHRARKGMACRLMGLVLLLSACRNLGACKPPPISIPGLALAWLAARPLSDVACRARAWRLRGRETAAVSGGSEYCVCAVNNQCDWS